MHDLPCVLIPGGVIAAARSDGEDAGKIQSIGRTLRAWALITLQEAADMGCRALPRPVAGVSFWARRPLVQVVGEQPLGLSLPHSGVALSGQPIWLDMARSCSGRAVVQLRSACGIRTRHILTDAAIRNAMVGGMACGGSTNLLLHIPAIAYRVGCAGPTVEDWNHG